jgi:hypothetical protein
MTKTKSNGNAQELTSNPGTARDSKNADSASNPKRVGSKAFDGDMSMKRAKTAGPGMTSQDLLG